MKRRDQQKPEIKVMIGEVKPNNRVPYRKKMRKASKIEQESSISVRSLVREKPDPHREGDIRGQTSQSHASTFSVYTNH